MAQGFKARMINGWWVCQHSKKAGHLQAVNAQGAIKTFLAVDIQKEISENKPSVRP